MIDYNHVKYNKYPKLKYYLIYYFGPTFTGIAVTLSAVMFTLSLGFLRSCSSVDGLSSVGGCMQAILKVARCHLKSPPSQYNSILFALNIGFIPIVTAFGGRS